MLSSILRPAEIVKRNSAPMEISPTTSDVMRRIFLGTPLLAAGGTCAAAIASHLSPFTFNLGTGAIVGATYGLMSMATSVALKVLLGGNVGFSRILTAIKAVVDCALTAVVSIALLAKLGTTLLPLHAILFIPASIGGAFLITGCELLSQEIIEIAMIFYRELSFQIQTEIANLGKY